MTLDERAPIDPNSADQETLCLLPGMGPVLAERLIAARPFETLPDLTRVSGIGAKTVERWRPYLALPSAAEPGSGQEGSRDVEAGTAPGGDAAQSAAVPAGETRRLAAKVEPGVAPDLPARPVPEAKEEEPAPDERVPEEEPEPPKQLLEEAPPAPQVTAPGKPPARTQPAATRRYAGCLVAASGILVLLLSIVISLGILARLNENQLRFASPAQANMLTVRVDGLEMRVEGLARDVEGLRARLNAVEVIGERMQALEGAAETLRADVDDVGERLGASEAASEALQSEVDAAATRVADLSTQLETIGHELSAMSGQVDELGADVETLQTESGRFQAFLEGLQALLGSLFQQGGQ